MKVVHFIGSVKPWHHSYNIGTGQVELGQGEGHSAQFLQHWWNIFVENVHPQFKTGPQVNKHPLAFLRPPLYDIYIAVTGVNPEKLLGRNPQILGLGVVGSPSNIIRDRP